MVEGGQTPLTEARGAGRQIRFSLVIFPGAITCSVLAKTAQAFYGTLAKDGASASWADRMFSFDALNADDRHGPRCWRAGRTYEGGANNERPRPRHFPPLLKAGSRADRRRDGREHPYRSAFNPDRSPEGRDGLAIGHLTYRETGGHAGAGRPKGLRSFVGAPMALRGWRALDRPRRHAREDLAPGARLLPGSTIHYAGGTISQRPSAWCRPIYRDRALFLLGIASVGQLCSTSAQRYHRRLQSGAPVECFKVAF